jgi:NAD(P)-dependent dehydrogenase (short-subunit alcohol dehydrogenase family)
LGEVRFPHPGRPWNEDRFVPFDKATGRQIENLLPIDGGVKTEIESLERLPEINRRASEPQLHPGKSARTAEGWELQFATNHLGHFALALGLREALAADGAGRIVAVSSAAHRRSPVVFEDIHFERRAYDPWLAYGQSKTANVLFAVEAARRWADDGITANALMPGGIVTNLQRYMDPAVVAGWSRGEGTGGMVLKTLEQGAATSVLLATSPELAGVSGRYFEDCNEAPVVANDSDASTGVRAYAIDSAAAKRLWEVSLEMLETPVPQAAA